MVVVFAEALQTIVCRIYQLYHVDMLCSIIEVVRKVGDITSNTYTPVAADRHGITLRCNDTEHSMWRVQNDIIKSMVVEPKCKLLCFDTKTIC